MENKYDVHIPPNLDLNDVPTTTGPDPVVVAATELAPSEYVYSIWLFETPQYGPRLRSIYRQGIIDLFQANGIYKRTVRRRLTVISINAHYAAIHTVLAPFLSTARTPVSVI